MSTILTPGSVVKGRSTVRLQRMPTDQEALEICKAFTATLDMIYPGYIWQAGMNQDLVYIQCMSLNKQLGYRLPLKCFDVEGKVLMRIGGEILERFNMRRGKADQNAKRSLVRDIRGDATPDT